MIAPGFWRGRIGLLFLIVTAVALAAACRGGGANPGDNVGIPQINPTPAGCLNDEYPPNAPEFGDNSSVPYTELPSGLKVHHITEGDGAAPASDSVVRVQYTGWLSGGCLFDSSYLREEPSQFALNQPIIDGWREGLATMNAGGHARFEIPPELAYGPFGFGATIPPNSTLVFDVELVEIVPPAEVTATAEAQIEGATATAEARATEQAQPSPAASPEETAPAGTPPVETPLPDVPGDGVIPGDVVPPIVTPLPEATSTAGP